MDRLKLDLKMPCPNCGGKDFGMMSDPYCILPSLVKGEEGYELSPDKGLGIMPVICNTCGYILLFHPPQNIMSPDSWTQKQPNKIELEHEKK